MINWSVHKIYFAMHSSRQSLCVSQTAHEANEENKKVGYEQKISFLQEKQDEDEML